MSIESLNPVPPVGTGWREVYREPTGLHYEVDGELVFAGTEEDLEVTEHDGALWARPLSEPFAVTDLSEADWVLREIAASEAQVAAIQLRKKALLANLSRQEKQHQSRADWFRMRYGDQVAAVAEAELKAQGGRRKTLTLDHGKVSFRSSKGTTRIVDEEAALAWAQEHCPDAISRKEWITATNARKALDAAKASNGATDDPRWIESTGPREIVRIETGLEATP